MRTKSIMIALVLLIVSPTLYSLLSVSHAETKDAAKQRPDRYGMVIGLKPEKMAYYNELHANPWKSVLDQITKANIHNYSIHLVELKPGEYYLFAYFEYTGDDFEADMKQIGEDAETQRWWKETDPCQYPIATAKKGDMWTKMKEVFYHP